MFTASRLTPYFYSLGLFRLIEFLSGREYAAWALNNYAVSLYCDKRYEASIKALSLAIELNSDSAQYWANRGSSRYTIGEYTEAIDDLRPH